MRWTAALLALGLGMVSASAGETSGAASAPPAPNLQPPASRDSSAQSGAQLSRSALDSTAITESTEDGRQIAAPTADRPAYVVTHSGGQHDFGQVPAGEKVPSAETLDQQVEQALGRLHFLRADASHPPSLLIVFSWGVHCLPGDEFEDRGYRNLLDRAALAGGSRFADELEKVLVQDGALSSAVSMRPIGIRLGGMRPTLAASLFQSISPIETFRRRDLKTEYLLQQITNDCYYVVISAFDYASVVRGKQQLLWRTKLTTLARGVSMADSIPALITNGAGYYGRDMNEPELFANRSR
jgi:hypothetical protein